MKVKANVVLAKCGKNNLYGIRIQKFGSDWFRTWAFKISQELAKSEGFQTMISGSLNNADNYPGCPYCGGDGFWQCGKCDKMSCRDYSRSTEVCGWCGNVATNFVSVDSFDFSGGGF